MHASSRMQFPLESTMKQEGLNHLRVLRLTTDEHVKVRDERERLRGSERETVRGSERERDCERE